MKHIILEDSGVEYNTKYSHYRFRLDSGYRTEYFKSSPSIPLNPDNTCTDTNFTVIKSKSGHWRIVRNRDTSQRCLLMMSANPKVEHEIPEIDTDLTTCNILEHYDVDSSINGLKIVAVLASSKMLFIKYTNRVLNSCRYEVYSYDAIKGSIVMKELTQDQLDTINRDKVILEDFGYDTTKFKVTKENFSNMTEDDISRANSWFARYHSFMKDA